MVDDTVPQEFESYEACVIGMQGKVDNAEDYCKKIFDALPPKAEEGVAEQKAEEPEKDKEKEEEEPEKKSNPLDLVQFRALKFYAPPKNKEEEETEKEEEDEKCSEKKATDLCTTCGGSGQVGEHECSMCQGTGHVQTEDPKKEEKTVFRDLTPAEEGELSEEEYRVYQRERGRKKPEDKDMRQESRTDKPGFGYPSHARQNEEDWKGGALGGISMRCSK